MSFIDDLKQIAGNPKILPSENAPGTGCYSLKTTDLSDIKMRPVKWLVPNLIPKGMFTLVAGHGGGGKSSMLAHFAACLSRGETPFGLSNAIAEPMTVAIYNCEDAVEEVLVPRLLAAGADLSKIILIQGIVDEAGNSIPFGLNQMAVVAEHHRKRAFDVLIIDPISSTIGNAGGNDNSETDIRPMLESLCLFCEQTKVSAIGVKHLGKGDRDTAAMRVLGSVAYSSVARMVLSLTKDPEDQERRILARSKTNLPVSGSSGITFRTESPPNAMAIIAENNPDLSPEDAEALAAQMYHCTDFQPWDGDIESLVNSGNAHKPDTLDRNSKKSAAAAWMNDFLLDGPKHSTQVVSSGNSALGFTFRFDWWRGILQDLLGGQVRKLGKEWFWASEGGFGDESEPTKDDLAVIDEVFANAQQTLQECETESEAATMKEDSRETHTPSVEFAGVLSENRDTEPGLNEASVFLA